MTAGVILGLVVGVVASVATHAGWLIKHRGAQRSPVMEHRHPWRSVRSLFASRAFAIGMVIATTGGLLHLAALALAPISVVQAVMAIGLVPLAIAAQRSRGRSLPRRQWAGVWCTSAGLLLFAIALPQVTGPHSTYRPATMIALSLALPSVGAALMLAATRRRLRSYAGALVGAGSGLLFGASDLAVKAGFGVAASGVLKPAVGIWLATALITGIGAQYVSARSLQLGDVITVTALTGLAVNTANILGGLAAFGDPLASGVPGTIIDLAAFAAICASALLTSVPDHVRDAEQPQPSHAAIATRRAPPPHGTAPAALSRPAPQLRSGAS